MNNIIRNQKKNAPISNGVNKNRVNPLWHSSYEKNNYGDFFYALMRIYQPEKVVELGAKAGYSAYHMARGLKANGKGTLDCYDLWEKYEFNSVPRSVAEKNLKKYKDIVNLNSQNAIGVDKKYPVRGREGTQRASTSNGVDILHIDLSNEGEILEKIIPRWIDKVRQLIIIEGGSRERDRLPWMIQFKKMPITKWLEEFSRRQGDIKYFTVEPFPSITIIKKNEF